MVKPKMQFLVRVMNEAMTVAPCICQTSADSIVRVLPVSRFCPDFTENRVRGLSAVRILSGFFVRIFCTDFLFERNALSYCIAYTVKAIQ